MVLNYHENYSLIEREILLKKGGGGEIQWSINGAQSGFGSYIVTSNF